MNMVTRDIHRATGQFSDVDALGLIDHSPESLLIQAAKMRDQGHDRLLSYSRKVFIPLTQLCRDSCHYCTFAQPPRQLEAAYLTPDQVLDIARAGKAAGCKEALFTLGDKPEYRYQAAREALAALGYKSTIEYLRAMALLVFEETGLLPHLNPGVMTSIELSSLREVSVSMGLMMESASERLMQKGGCHYGSPDKEPARRLESIDEAGRQSIAFTTGILIGIGETRTERIESLLTLRASHARFGHLQEIIIQNFRAKAGTRMALAVEPDIADLQWTVAVARLIFGPHMNIQAPPNLSITAIADLIAAGINDFGGVSPVTPDHVNPEAPWPHLDDLAKQTAASGKIMVERLAIYPEYIRDREHWLDPAFQATVLDQVDGESLARSDDWSPGDASKALPELPVTPGFSKNANLDAMLDKAIAGDDLNVREVTRLLTARDGEVHQITEAADFVRQEMSGETASYVVTRNINYTNICYFKCKFCAFSKGKKSEELRGRPYSLGLDEITQRVREAWDRGAVEVCLQGGIHPDYTGKVYLNILRAIKSEMPDIHVHAFSPLEIFQGADTLNVSVPEFLDQLVEAGLGSLPGTAAEILDDEVRDVLCPDKLSTADWFKVVDAAHRAGLKTTATIMFGHIEQPVHQARHLLRLREQQKLTGGFTELVPLPFVHMEAPIYLKGGSRRGPTWRETILIHAVARLALNPHISNIQASWVKLGLDGVAACLGAGVNDIGGTLMGESITRAAGAGHGQEMTPEAMEDMLVRVNRPSRQRTTLYADACEERRQQSMSSNIILPPIRLAG